MSVHVGATTALKAVIYLRLSVSKEESVSIEKTKRDCIEWCRKHGHEVSEDRILVDDGLSGSIRRAKADQALQMLATGEADVLVVWKFDRWSRQGIIAVGDLMSTLLRTAPRTRFVALQDNLDSTQPFFPLMAAFFAEQAKIERENTRLRVTTTFALLATKGRWTGGQIPFGYTPVPCGNGAGYNLGHDEDEQPVLREAIGRVLAGEPVAAIVDDFNARGVRTPRRGKAWHRTTLHRLLRNPILRGMHTWGGSNPDKGEWNIVLGEDGLPIRPHEATVSDDEWFALQAALNARANTMPEVVIDGYLLKGLAVCDYCDKNMAHRDRRLACSRHRKDLPCPGCIIDMEKTEAFVTSEFLARYGSLPVMEEVEVEQDTTRVREIVEALELVGRKMRDADTPEDEAKWSARKWELRAELKRLETTVSGGPTLVRRETGTTYEEEWVSATDDKRREYLKSFVRQVRIKQNETKRRAFLPERIDIRWFEDEAVDEALADLA